MLYFAAFIVVVVFMMFNMVIAIIMKTYDAVASEVTDRQTSPPCRIVLAAQKTSH